MQVKGVDFISYDVSDYNKGVSFYKDTLGLKLIDEYGGFWAEFEVGNVTLALCAPPHAVVPEPNYKGGAIVALAVDDVKEAVKELKEKSVAILSEPEDTGVCVMATITDPDGNKIILHQRKDGSAG